MSAPIIDIPAASPILTPVKVLSPQGGTSPSVNNPLGGGNNCDLGEIYAEGSAPGTGVFREVWGKAYPTGAALPAANDAPPMGGANSATPGIIYGLTSGGSSGRWRFFGNLPNVNSDTAFPAIPTAQSTLVIWTKFSGEGGVYANTQIAILGESAEATAIESYSGFWQFNEGAGATAADISGNANTLTLINPNNVAMWQTDKPGPALTPNSILFDGASTYCRSTTVRGLPTGNMSRTIAFWYYLRSLTAGNNCAFVSLGNTNDGAGNDRFIVQLAKVGGDNYIFTDGVNSANNLTLADNQLPTLNAWHHFAFTYEGSTREWAYYQDGTKVTAAGNNPFSNNLNTETNVLEVGSRHDTATGIVDAALKDVRIYNYALSGYEVGVIHNPGTFLQPPQPRRPILA